MKKKKTINVIHIANNKQLKNADIEKKLLELMILSYSNSK